MINGTSLGMRPDDDLPIGKSLTARCDLIADCVIVPETTKLLQEAVNQGKAFKPAFPCWRRN